MQCPMSQQICEADCWDTPLDCFREGSNGPWRGIDCAVTSCDTAITIRVIESHDYFKPCLLRTSSSRSSTPTHYITHPPLPSFSRSRTPPLPSSRLLSRTGSPPASSTSSTFPIGHGSAPIV